VLQRMNEQDTIFYIHEDHPGSFDVISNPDGTVKERYNYDPCVVRQSIAKVEGRRRNPSDWSYDNVSSSFYIDRGFTGHEHRDQFGLINMLSEAKSRSLQASGNGRVYDPLMAMFLSPDNFVQSPDLTQNFNRYTYCLNNPLKFSDPSGNNYMQLLEMAYEGNFINYYGPEPGGGGNGQQIPFPEDFADIDGGSYARWSPPGSMYQEWMTNPALQFEYPSYEDFNAAQGYYVYVKQSPTTTYEKFSIKSHEGYFEITLPIVEICYKKIWISTAVESNQGGGGEPDGMVYSFSFDFAFGGGAGFEIGLVTDKNGGRQWFASGNTNIGYGISAGPNVRTIKSLPGSTFKASDYLGYSAGFSVGLFDVGGFYGGNKPQWNFTDFMDFGDSYIENGLGISKIKAPVFGAWWSNTSTKQLFGR